MDKYFYWQEDGRHKDQDENRTAQIVVREEVQDSGRRLQSNGEETGQLGRKDAERKQGQMERHEDLQKQRHTVESEMQKNGGASLQCILLRTRKLVLEKSDPGENQSLGDKGHETSVQIQK